METTQSYDTRLDAEQVLLRLLRGKSPAQKLSQVRSLSQLVIGLSRRAIARANQGKDPVELDLLFIRLHYGEALARKVAACLGQGGE
ncbi:MAG: hypothetical protein JW820_10635 [Spirochaetales bacterium]|nr:hypothetical protein [Spirochaetales bacterium]